MIPEQQKQNILKASFVLAGIVAVFFITLICTEIKKFRLLGNDTPAVNIISFTGKGEVNATPDVAVLTANINGEGSTRADAVTKQAVLKKKITDALVPFKIADKDIKTEYISTNPKYEYKQSTIYCVMAPCPQPEGKNVIVGYTTNEQLVIKVRNVDDAGAVYDALSKLGSVDISGPNLQIDNDEALRAEARKIAIDDAKSKAEVLARDLGVHLVRIVSFNEDGYANPVYRESGGMMYDAKAVSAPAPTTNISAGENKITSNVTISYEIR
ncbi:MAG: SIMPL domain-containing protein [Minisyncoccia bacterium]